MWSAQEPSWPRQWKWFFVSKLEMSSSDLSGALTSAWRKAGMIGNDRRISGTLMRKSCTTAVRNHNNKVKGSVAANMALSEHTADKHYHIVQKRANSAFATRQLAAIIHGNSHIKLCLLLWFEYSKTMRYCCPSLGIFRCRKITLGLNRIQSALSWWWHFCSQREPTWENTDRPAGGE